MTITSDFIVFSILALIAIVSALGMLVSKNAIYAALYLVINFVVVAVFYLTLGAPFLALAQVAVYAGAIMVLFLFVIMLLGAEVIPPTPALPYQKWLARGLALLLAVGLGLWIYKSQLTAFIAQPEANLNDMQVVRTMSTMLFNQYLLPFEVTSILLLVAMIGAIVLTRKDLPKKAGKA